MVNFSLDHVFYQFVRGVVLAFLTGIISFLLILGLNFLAAQMEGLPTLFVVLNVLGFSLILALLFIIDGLVRQKILRDVPMHFARATGQLLFTSLFIFVAIGLFVFLFVAVANQDFNKEVFKFIGPLVLFLILKCRSWYILYSESELKVLELISLFLAVFSIGFIIYFVSYDALTPLTFATIILAVFLVVESILYDIFYLFYYGLNNFYGTEFLHFNTTKTPKEETPQG